MFYKLPLQMQCSTSCHSKFKQLRALCNTKLHLWHPLNCSELTALIYIYIYCVQRRTAWRSYRPMSHNHLHRWLWGWWPRSLLRHWRMPKRDRWLPTRFRLPKYGRFIWLCKKLYYLYSEEGCQIMQLKYSPVRLPCFQKSDLPVSCL